MLAVFDRTVESRWQGHQRRLLLGPPVATTCAPHARAGQHMEKWRIEQGATFIIAKVAWFHRRSPACEAIAPGRTLLPSDAQDHPYRRLADRQALRTVSSEVANAMSEARLDMVDRLALVAARQGARHVHEVGDVFHNVDSGIGSWRRPCRGWSANVMWCSGWEITTMFVPRLMEPVRRLAAPQVRIVDTPAQ